MANQPASDDNQVKLEFFLIEQPGDINKADFRRKVRSHVTSLQHRRGRHSTARRRAGESSHQWEGRLLVNEPASEIRPGPRRQRGRNGRKTTKANAVETTKARILETTQLAGEQTSVLNAYIVPNSVLGKAFSLGSMAFRTFTLNDRDNVVGTSLKRLQLDVSCVLGCYEFIVAFQAQDFERQYTVEPGSAWRKFLPFIFADPVVVNTAILLTTRYLLSPLEESLPEKELYQVLRLQGFLIRSINAALEDPVRSCSDQLLVAVALFASYEIKYGSRQTYHVHMCGLISMINARGGLPEIGRHDPYLERLILWLDSNTAKIAGCEPYCQRVKTPSMLAWPKPGTEMFRMKGKLKGRRKQSTESRDASGSSSADVTHSHGHFDGHHSAEYSDSTKIK